MMYIADVMAPLTRRPVSSEKSPTRQAEAVSESTHASDYTIDDLAALAQVPSRTIRFYQSKGALMSPEIRGRVAYYGKAHLERLKLIAQLQDRGLRIDAIAGLVKSIERGELDLAEWLGVEQQLSASWANDQARTVTEAELLELAGNRRPGLIADLTRVKLIERRGEVYLVESPALLGVAMKLEAAGIDQQTSADAAEVLRKHFGRAVSELTELLLKRAHEGAIDITQPTKLFEQLRPVAIEAVRILFAKQAEQAMRKLLESGALASFRSRVRRRPRSR